MNQGIYSICNGNVGTSLQLSDVDRYVIIGQYYIFSRRGVNVTLRNSNVFRRDLRSSIFWNIMSCSPKSTGVTEANVASIFIAEE
jgi:hypothetical protein